MNKTEFQDFLQDNPIIAAVKDDSGVEKCINCKSKIVFILYGTVSSIAKIVKNLKNAGKIVFVHIDFIDGLAPREASIDFLKETTNADGIISTKGALIKHAKHRDMLAIQRFFVLDSISLVNIPKQTVSNNADVVEVLPGLIPRVISRLVQENDTPVIASGLIAEKDDVFHALSAGAIAVSTTNQNVWFF